MTDRPKALVLMQYPTIEPKFSDLKKQLDCDLELLIVSTIAARGHLELIRKLRRQKYDKLFLVIADDTVLTLTSILMLLSAFVPASERFLLFPNRDIQRFTLMDCIDASFKITCSLIRGGVSLALLQVSALFLLRQGRVKVSASIEDFHKRLYYFRTNLWLGVQAGGALTHTWGVINAAARAGWHITYFSADKQGIGVGTNVKFVPAMPKNVYVVPRELNHVLYNNDFLDCAAEEISGVPGIIYQRTSIANYCGVKVSRQLGLPLIVEYNGSEGWLSRNWGTPFLFSGAVDAVEEVSLKHAHMIVTVSEPLREELQSRGVPDERILVHPNGVDLQVFSPSRYSDTEIAELRKSLDIPVDGILVTFVGTFGPWHGAEILAHAAKKLLSGSDNNSLYFLFIGDGVRRETVERIASDLIEAKRVVLTGLMPPSEIPRYLAASDILTAPTIENPDHSTFFGSPTKLFEYMATGRAVVASGLGQILDVLEKSPYAEELCEQMDAVNHDACGVLIRPGNTDDLVNAIRITASDSELRAQLGKNARKRVEDRYTWDGLVEKVFSRLSEVVQLEATPRVRVLINALHSKSGGGVTYLKNLLPYLRESSQIEVHICLHRDQRHLFQDALDGVTLHEFTFKQGFWRLLLREQIAIPLLSLKIKADVTFSPANYGPIFARRAVLLLRNSLAVAFVERRLVKLAYWGLLYLGTAASMIAAKRIISVSSYASSSGAGTLRVFAKNCDIVPHGVSPRFLPDESVNRVADELLVVADIYVQKNLHTLIAAMSEIVAEYPGLKLRIAGAEIDRDYASNLKSQISAFNLDNNVIFEGSVGADKLVQLYQRCTVFVFPSTVETFGNPLVEAMAAGVPIACSNSSAMPEIAGDAVAYFDPHDVSDIASVVINLLGDEDRRKELSQKALERAQMYSWKETARKTIKVLIEASRR